LLSTFCAETEKEKASIKTIVKTNFSVFI